jgi:transcription antitermination factor NusG
MPYWTACRLQPHREALALHCLSLNGFETYYPRLRDRRIRFGRTIENRPALFPGYAFVLIQLQWHTARWAPGTLGLIMDGVGPAKVADAVIAEIRRREVDGLIELPMLPLRRGVRVKILRGPFSGHLAIFADMRPRQRCEVLLRLLGGQHRVSVNTSGSRVLRLRRSTRSKASRRSIMLLQVLRRLDRLRFPCRIIDSIGVVVPHRNLPERPRPISRPRPKPPIKRLTLEYAVS